MVLTYVCILDYFRGMTTGGPTIANGTLSCLSQSKLAELHNLKWKLVKKIAFSVKCLTNIYFCQ